MTTMSEVSRDSAGRSWLGILLNVIACVAILSGSRGPEAAGLLDDVEKGMWHMIDN